jgi:uncharacterized membrane protein YeaQ/YmgE (transglycosylase-associated protein family)
VGYIVLLAVGAVLAWLASILTRSDDARAIFLHLVVGTLGALVVGALASRESLIVGISPTALFAGIGGAVALLTVLAFARVRMVR